MRATREQQRHDQRNRILDCARRLFADRGPDGVTMAEVAAEAGVARATVFNQFGSKHALIEAITEDVLAGYVGLLENALADRESPTPLLIRALFDAMGHGIEADRRFYRGVFREIAKRSMGLDEGGPGQLARQMALDRLTLLLTRGQARGDLTREHGADDLAAAFDSLVFGTITHWLYDDASEALHLRMGRAAGVLLAPLAAGVEEPGPLPAIASSEPRRWSEALDPSESEGTPRSRARRRRT